MVKQVTDKAALQITGPGGENCIHAIFHSLSTKWAFTVFTELNSLKRMVSQGCREDRDRLETLMPSNWLAELPQMRDNIPFSAFFHFHL